MERSTSRDSLSVASTRLPMGARKRNKSWPEETCGKISLPRNGPTRTMTSSAVATYRATTIRRRNFSAGLLRPTFVALSGPHRQPRGSDRKAVSRRAPLHRKSRWAGECDDHFGVRWRTAAELPHQYDLSMDERPARSGLALRAES